MKNELPAIANAAARVAVVLDDAATRFARKHRYTLGVRLCDAAREVYRRVDIAWYERQRKLQRVHEISIAIDALKREMRLADMGKAFGSKAELEMVARLVRDLGRQVGGWLNSLQRKGQNAAAERQPQRAQILSSRDAPPAGAHP